MVDKKDPDISSNKKNSQANSDSKSKTSVLIEEQGGVDRLEPTRYGDWEKGGRCIDF